MRVGEFHVKQDLLFFTLLIGETFYDYIAYHRLKMVYLYTTVIN